MLGGLYKWWLTLTFAAAVQGELATRSMSGLMASILATSVQANHVGILHGSGTTNPSKLFWQAMELISERAKLPTHMTYRAVGSSTGQKEFLGASNANTALNHFGAGDIPMTGSRFNAVKNAGRSMVHVPFALGGIGVFHSVPTADLGGEPLDLTGCLLAKIFSRQITRWDHAEIKALNPKMTASGEIKVVHRKHGSSSTAGFTSYLQGKCPPSWDLGTGSTITWPAGTFEAQGSGGMSSFIKDNENAIGYIDAGHGHGAGLGEVALQNKDGAYLTTRQADIGAAATVALAATGTPIIPTDPALTWEDVNLYDMSGPTTWPITMISYFYLEQDWSAMDPVTAGLLHYFINFILKEEGQALAEANKFVKLPDALKSYNTLTLNTLTMPASMPTFTTEHADDTLPEVGMGEYVISGKRRSFGEVERTKLLATQADLVAHDAAESSPVTITTSFGEWSVDEKKFTAAAAAAALAISILGLIIALFACCTAVRNSRASQPRSREIPAPVRNIEVPKNGV